MELRSLAGTVQCLEAGLGVGFISDLALTDQLTALRLPALTRRRRFFLSHKLRHESILPVVEAILRYAGQAAGNTKKIDADKIIS
jgi:DNA-binding transcriptional LysR family regulator